MIKSVNTASADWTSLQGYITVPYQKLIETFGKPEEGDGYKVDAEWVIEFEDGTIATIYNWKNGKNYCGSSGLPVSRIEEWNVGGKDKDAVKKVCQILGVKETPPYTFSF